MFFWGANMILELITTSMANCNGMVLACIIDSDGSGTACKMPKKNSKNEEVQHMGDLPEKSTF